MAGADLRKKLESGGIVYGTMLSLSRNPRWARVIGQLKFDYVIIDNEHSAYSRGEVADFIAALNATGTTPLIRVPIPSSHYVTMAVDAGAHGVLAPYCETVDEVKEVVGAAKWRPLKGAVVRRVMETGEFPSQASKEYLQNINANSIVMIGIESVPAVENLEAILKVKGIDAIFVGPNDLSISMGIPNQYEHPDFEEMLRFIIRTSSARNIPVAVHLHSVAATTKWMKEGVRFVLHITDTRAMHEGFRNDFEAIRKFASEIQGRAAERVKESDEVI
jgi:4-hydroxy-2-oxoheptanedioate aldolase